MEVGGCEPHNQAASTPGKNRYPLHRRLGDPQDRSGRAENLVPTGIRFQTFQPVISSYIDWATRPTRSKYFLKFEIKLMTLSLEAVLACAWCQFGITAYPLYGHLLNVERTFSVISYFLTTLRKSLQRDTAKLSLLVKIFFVDVTCSECMWIDL
jgi:hypothetical protein